METITQPTQSIDITLTDLELVRTIIDLASSRGAFRANELKEVGEIYNKLTTFLEAVIAKSQAAETASNETSTQGE